MYCTMSHRIVFMVTYQVVLGTGTDVEKGCSNVDSNHYRSGRICQDVIYLQWNGGVYPSTSTKEIEWIVIRKKKGTHVVLDNYSVGLVRNMNISWTKRQIDICINGSQKASFLSPFPVLRHIQTLIFFIWQIILFLGDSTSSFGAQKFILFDIQASLTVPGKFEQNLSSTKITLSYQDFWWIRRRELRRERSLSDVYK